MKRTYVPLLCLMSTTKVEELLGPRMPPQEGEQELLSARLPVGLEAVPCGWASPAQDYHDGGIELPRQLVPHPEFTFVYRACGRSMEGAGIFDGDFIAVDRLRDPEHGDVVLVETPDGFTVKRLILRPRPFLFAASPDYPPIPLTEDMRCLGVVILCIHTVRREGVEYDFPT